MPYIEQVSLGEQWDFNKKWHEHAESTRNTVPDLFLCPSRRAGTTPDWFNRPRPILERYPSHFSEERGPGMRSALWMLWVPGPRIIRRNNESAQQEAVKGDFRRTFRLCRKPRRFRTWRRGSKRPISITAATERE